MEFDPKVKVRGGEYVLVPRDEPIKEGAIHTLDGRVYNPLCNPDSVGQTPADFSADRAFYNLVKEREKTEVVKSYRLEWVVE